MNHLYLDNAVVTARAELFHPTFNCLPAVCISMLKLLMVTCCGRIVAERCPLYW